MAALLGDLANIGSWISLLLFAILSDPSHYIFEIIFLMLLTERPFLFFEINYIFCQVIVIFSFFFKISLYYGGQLFTIFRGNFQNGSTVPKFLTLRYFSRKSYWLMIMNFVWTKIWKTAIFTIHNRTKPHLTNVH